MPAPRSLKAFTLIELLVVISIIALLIGILLPALGAARQTARISSSASNQRQIGIAMAAYQADNKEFFPAYQNRIGITPGGNVPGDWYWTTQLAVQNYIPGLEIYADPSFEGDTSFLEEVTAGGRGGGTSNGVTKQTQHARVYNWVHYGYNYVWVGSNLAAHAGSRPNTGGARQDGTPAGNPARVFEMADPTSVLVTSGAKDFAPTQKHTDTSTPTIDPNGSYGAHVLLDYGIDGIGNTSRPHARYNNQIQNSWGDGHVSTLSMPFTQEEQDTKMLNGYGSFDGNGGLYGPNALGNCVTWGSAGGRGGGSDPGNYFDLRADNPNN